MGYFNYDYYDNMKVNKLFLANPQKTPIGMIKNVSGISFSIKDNDINTLTFSVHNELNGEIDALYDKIENGRLIEVENLGWWIIKEVSEKPDDDGNPSNNAKDVTLASLEYELATRKIYDINGVYKLYDITDEDHSLLHLVAKSCNWRIGHVDNDLKNKWRSFSIDVSFIYTFLTNTLSKSYNCIIDFNTDSRLINVHKLEDHGTDTNIVLSRRNIMDSYLMECNVDDIVTKLTVKGGDGVDIRAVNPTGKNYIMNFDYFKTTDWMSQSLIDSLNSWELACSTNSVAYETNLNTLKTKQSELATLESDLKNLESQVIAEQRVLNNILVLNNNIPPDTTNPSYSLYVTTLGNITSINTQIASKNGEISAKNSELSVVQENLDNINSILDENNYFSSDDLIELDHFIRENDDYTDDTFIQTDTMTEYEVTEMKNELMLNGSNELTRVSSPQYTINIDLKNLFTIADNKIGFTSYKNWRESFQVGNIVTVVFDNNYSTQARISQIDYDFEDKENIKVVITDRSRFDGAFSEIGSILSKTSTTSKSYSLSKYGYDKSKSMNDEVSSIINDGLTTAVNSLKNNNNQEVVLDDYGLWMKKWIDGQNKYDDCMSVLTNNKWMISDDGFETAKAALGQLQIGTNIYYGLLAEVIIGNLIMGEKLNITNNSGSYTIGENGLVATFDDYTVCINPTSAENIFRITVGGNDIFYIDAVTGKLVLDGSGEFSGSVTADSGEIAGFELTRNVSTGDGGFIFDDPSTGKFIRISPYSSMTGTGGYNTNFGAIDLGLADDGMNTLTHLRSDGYARFGLVSEGGYSVRFNDFLRFQESGGTTGTETILYSQNFSIDTDGTVHIKSMDVPKAISDIAPTLDANDNIVSMTFTFEDDTQQTVSVGYDSEDRITNIGNTTITW